MSPARRGKRALSLIAAAAIGSAVFLHAAPTAGRPGDPAPHPVDGVSLTRQVIGYLDRLYVDPERLVPLELVAGALLGLEKRVPEVRVSIDEARTAALLFVAGESRRFDLAGLRGIEDAIATLEQVVAFVADRAARAAGAEDHAYTALRGALETLDPHTRVMSPEERQGFEAMTQGAFGGIGITFDPAPGGILVRDAIAGAPAALAGIGAGDLIAAADGVPLAGLPVSGMQELVRGKPGTAVTLSVSRGGADPVDRRVVRDLVREPSVRARLVRDGGAPVLHVALERFQPDTAAELKAALADAGAEAEGIVLDLRGNPGGILDEALAVADIFLDEGVILSTRDRSRRETVYRAAPYGIVRAQPPLAVLINRGSASAAEVVAAALRPARALLVGETSFGKGSVQQVLPLADGGGLSLTIRHYQTPGGVSIQAHGIDPDLALRTIVVGERVVFGGPTQHLREALLPRAFSAPVGADGPGAVVATPGPLWEVSTLRTALDPVIGPRTPPSVGDDPGRRAAEDFALRAALVIVRRAAGAGDPAGRPGVLAAARAAVPALAAEEERRIGEALAARGVDWSAAPEDAAGAASLRVEMPEAVIVRPGERTRVTLRVTNTGGATAFRVWGRTASGNPALANVDFAFGSIPPGEHREATAELAGPRSALRRWDSFGLALHQGSVASGSFAGGALMTGADQPVLSYTLRVADENTVDAALDGDGRLARGERLHLSLRISGTSDPGDLTLRLSPDAAGGLAIARREQPVSAGSSGAVSFDGVLAAEGPPAVRVGVSLASQSFGQVISDQIELPLDAPYRPALERRPPLVSAVGEVPPERTADADLELRVAVTDETGVKDVFVLVNGRKLFYRRGSEGQSRLPVDFRVDLAPGSNLIEVVARDSDNLSTRRSYYVYRASAG